MSIAILYIPSETLYGDHDDISGAHLYLFELDEYRNDTQPFSHKEIDIHNNEYTDKLKTYEKLVVATNDELFLYLTLEVPRKQSRYLNDAIAYLCEDYLCEELENYQFAYIYNAKTLTADVLCTNAKVIEKIQQFCLELEFHPHTITTHSAIKQALHSSIENDEEKQVLTLPDDIHLQDNPSHQSITETFKEITYKKHTRIDKKHVLGFFIEKNRKQETTLAKTALIVATGCCFMALALIGYNIYSTSMYNKESTTIKNEYTQIYKKAFPQEKRILNVPKQLAGKLNRGNLNSKNFFFDILVALTNSKKESGIELNIKLLQYNKGNANILLTWETESRDDVDLLRKALTQKITTKTLSVSENKGKTVAIFELSKKL